MHPVVTTRPPLVLLAIVLAALVVAACAPTADPGDEADESNGTEEPAADAKGDERIERLRLAGGDYGQPTPFAWVRGPGRILAGYQFDTLLWWDASGEFGPWLAEDWEPNNDGTEWTFTLHEDIAWQDGEPLTADDVAFSFDYYTEGAAADTGRGGALEVVDDVVAEDERTVTFALPQPYAAFESDVAGSMMILPEHIWADVDDPQQYLQDDAFVGSGPYRLVEYDEAAGNYLFEANDDFFLGEPHVQRVEFVTVEDELLALERGELDVAEIAREPLPDEQYDAFDAQYGRVDGFTDWNLALHFNLDEGFPYNEVDFRHAVAHAVDQHDMVDRLVFGRGLPGSSGGLAPEHEFNPGDLPSYDDGPDRARELLDGLGIEDTDGDGTRELPDGEPFQIELLASARFTSDGPELVSEYLGEVDLDVEVKILDRSAADEAGAEGNYTMALHGYGGLMSDPDTLRQRYHSEAEPRGHSTVHGYANDEVDQLAEAQLTATDPDKRREIVVDLQREIAEDLPVLSTYVPTRYLFYDEATFDGWYYTPGCSPCRGSRNKHMFVTGQETGLPDQSSS